MPPRYWAAWCGMLALAIANGALRDLVYSSWLSPLGARQLSTLTLLLLFGGYFLALFRRWPPASRAQAWRIGAIWLLLTLLFEFGLGRAAGHSWDELRQAYNLAAGQLWPLVPLWVLLGPPVLTRDKRPRR